MKGSSKKPSIQFHYLVDDFKLKNKKLHKQTLLALAIKEEAQLGTVNYVFCSDEYLLQMNKEYLNHDFYTDILSFPLSHIPVEGDIYISIDRVRENADTYKTDFSTELSRVIAHGMLHFLGYDDHAEENIMIMRTKENEFIETLKEKLG